MNELIVPIAVLMIFLLMYGYIIVQVIFSQVLRDQKLEKSEKVMWIVFLALLPFYGLWAWNYRKSKRKSKNIFRY